MLHPHTQVRYKNDIIGYGVFATASIPCGTILWVRDVLDSVFSQAYFDSLPAHYHALIDHYTFRNRLGDYVLCWDATRMINHSCAPTSAGTEFDFEVALRDLQIGDEITNDYALFNLKNHESFDCYCTETTCRDYISRVQYEDSKRTRRKELKHALQYVNSVPQPLSDLLTPQQLENCLKILTCNE
jgi:uncharacterized protein